MEMRVQQKKIKDMKKLRGEKSMLQIRQDLSTIIEAGIKCICPSVIIPKKIKYDGRQMLIINNVKYKINNNLHIVGWGKEVVTMSSAFERLVDKQLKKGFIVVPRKSISMMSSFPEAFPKLDSRITFVEADTEGQPDEKAIEMTRKIANYCKQLKKRDLLIVMLSRDLDDLLCYPHDTITLGDKLKVLNRLKTANATLEEINIVRNKLSAIRGGDLARLAYPAKVITLFTSEMSAEPPEQLGGGPCVYDPKDQTALAILTKYNLIDKVSQSVREVLGKPNPRTTADAQLDEKKRYKFVQQYVIACNADAIECMAARAFKLGLSSLKLNSTCGGTVEEFAQEYVKIASLMILAVENKITKLEMYEQMKESTVCPLTDREVWEMFPTKDKWGLGLCLLLGGRPTVHLGGEHPGKGGPNQELALYFSIYWYMRTKQYPILREYTVWFLGGSSHGRDGNTNAAGAFGYKSLATDIYPEYEKARSVHRAALLKWRGLSEDKQKESDIAIARQAVKDAEETMIRYAAILPERVLKENNTNLFFSSINDGDELLQLRSENYYTLVDVGDLHIIRIARFQCNCTCHEDEVRIEEDSIKVSYNKILLRLEATQ
ncbi:PREDICTED: glycerate kinase-like isoform X2 [Wasmannia auropunctata]|uniref:glycerate kinase-like isoform X2 n=1 Tax=Wasmannia auropunctata TaxID=64793 RepID=UPI0005F0BA65|nr:PREDICTED: glycerate kinase-like isoform X2 [Wasmannia auropunctata]XP_011704706.1 PREDICTED: glycerate kinase-like isoform X2 [Wasmannia auropunctata]